MLQPAMTAMNAAMDRQRSGLRRNNLRPTPRPRAFSSGNFCGHPRQRSRERLHWKRVPWRGAMCAAGAGHVTPGTGAVAGKRAIRWMVRAGRARALLAYQSPDLKSRRSNFAARRRPERKWRASGVIEERRRGGLAGAGRSRLAESTRIRPGFQLSPSPPVLGARSSATRYPQPPMRSPRPIDRLRLVTPNGSPLAKGDRRLF